MIYNLYELYDVLSKTVSVLEVLSHDNTFVSRLLGIGCLAGQQKIFLLSSIIRRVITGERERESIDRCNNWTK